MLTNEARLMIRESAHIIGIDPCGSQKPIGGIVKLLHGKQIIEARNIPAMNRHADAVVELNSIILMRDETIIICEDQDLVRINPKTGLMLHEQFVRWQEAADCLSTAFLPVSPVGWQAPYGLRGGRRGEKTRGQKKQDAIDLAERIFGVRMLSGCADASLIALWAYNEGRLATGEKTWLDELPF